MSYKIKKTLYFCYGHRLLNHKGRCRNIHGHNAALEITIQAEALDDMGMVTDFGDVTRIAKVWLDKNLDHKILLNSRDPLVKVLRKMKEPFMEVNANPTAEVMAEMIYRALKAKKLPVTKVKLWETPDSCAIYQERDTRSEEIGNSRR